MRYTHLSAALVALALAITSCGGDDSNDSAAPATTTTTTQQSQTTPEQSTADKSGSKQSKAPGSGGSSSADADRATQDEKQSGAGRSDPAAAKTKRGAAAPKTPQELIAALSPEELRALHKDLYEQGKTACYAYGTKELAKSYNLPGSDPVSVAKRYAEAYEKATPSLILPYQQGCLAGLRRHDRNPPKN